MYLPSNLTKTDCMPYANDLCLSGTTLMASVIPAAAGIVAAMLIRRKSPRNIGNTSHSVKHTPASASGKKTQHHRYNGANVIGCNQ